MSKKMIRQFECSMMMLPEHRGLLRQQAARNHREEENSRPHLDEQEQVRLQHVLEQAMLQKKPLAVTFIKEGERRSCRGIPLRCTQGAERIIYIVEESGCISQIRAGEVIGLELLDCC